MITEPFRPVRGIGMAASVLIGLEALLAIADGFVTEHSANVVREYTDGNGTMEDLHAADSVALMVNVPTILVSIASGVTFIMWLYRSRRNAERVSYPVEHRHSRGWVIGSWFVPIVNFWYPLQVVQDVWRAFDPAQRDRPLQARDSNGFILVWWLVFTLMSIVDRVASRLLLNEDTTMDTVATWTWGAAVITIAAAALAIVLVRRLTDLQYRTAPQEFSGPVQVHVPGA